jgi:NADP-dependent 3-hydroxy acid dehydrogenase YdfG
VISGGSSGLGAAIARGAVAAGAEVGVPARRRELLAQLAAESGIVPRVCDISDDAAAELAIDELADRLGGIDALVNCAGVMLHSRVTAGSRDDWRQTLAINVQGTMNATISALAHLRRSTPSDLLFISSPSADRVASPAAAMYSASKAALSRLAEGLHAEFEAEALPIRVTVVKPGYIASDGLLANIRDPEFKAQVIERGRTIALTADDVAGQVIHILSLAPHLRVSELSISRTPGRPPEPVASVKAGPVASSEPGAS